MSLGLASHTPERLLQPGETYQALLGTFGRGALLLRGAQDFPGPSPSRSQNNAGGVGEDRLVSALHLDIHLDRSILGVMPASFFRQTCR
jgi:hypothetical protein